MVTRIDVLGFLGSRVLVAEVIGGYYGQAALGRWWLPSAELRQGEQPSACAVRAVRDTLGLALADPVVVGTRQEEVGGLWQLALVLAGAISGEPTPNGAVSGFSVREIPDLPDQVGFYHRDVIDRLAQRYSRLRA